MSVRTESSEPSEAPHRAGFAVVGRPNAAVTLTNALVGQKVAITASAADHAAHGTGIVHRPDAQLILVDTPGLHKLCTLLVSV